MSIVIEQENDYEGIGTRCTLKATSPMSLDELDLATLYYFNSGAERI